MMLLLREYVPLKQGLRPSVPFGINVLLISPRVCSIKTRIKTRVLLHATISVCLREYVPLKQGLRRRSQNELPSGVVTPRVCSLKTRIKTTNSGGNSPKVGDSESMFH